MNPGAGWPSKIWPAERYGELARHLAKTHGLASVAVWGVPSELPLAEPIVATSGGHARLAPPTSMTELAALCRRAALFVGSDTGPMHLAVAVGTPTISLHGPSRADWCGAYGPENIRLQVRYEDGSAFERRKADDSAMRAIDVEMVADACDRLLRAARGAAMWISNRIRVYTVKGDPTMIRPFGIFSSVFVGLIAATAVQAQSLDGVWEISSVIDNGRVVAPTEIRTNYAADGRVTINGQVAQFILPMTYQRKQLPFAVDVTKSPARLDLAGAEKTGGRGIIMPSKDSLILCLAGRDKPRPTAFAPGPDILFISLQRATGDAAATPDTRTSRPPTPTTSFARCSSAPGAIRTKRRSTTSRSTKTAA